MKSLFETEGKNEVLSRLTSLSERSTALWGKMTVAQMLAHCGNALEMAMGIIHPKRVFIGRLIGSLLKHKYEDDTPFSKSSPTSKEIEVRDVRNFTDEKKRLIALIEKFHAGKEGGVTKSPHPFFGTLTPMAWGKGMYKHLDHHFRQFNV